MSLVPQNANWLVPRHPFSDGTPDDALAQELHSELCASHVLFGIPVCAVGRRQDCDDVLFALLDGTGRFAAVHLTYAQHPEKNPIWPETTIFKDWEHFESERMKPDHAEWST